MCRHCKLKPCLCPVRDQDGQAVIQSPSRYHNSNIPFLSSLVKGSKGEESGESNLVCVNIQRLLGSQRAMKSVEDFTEFKQRAAYFDGDPVIATKKGVNILERGSQVHFMAEFMALVDFPPAPKLGIDGKLDLKKATESEKRGQAIFFGRAACGSCHAAPYYTDNLMHNLKAERFYKARMINGRMASAHGPIKTFPLRGIKDTPPYLHDGRLLTLLIASSPLKVLKAVVLEKSQ